MSHNSALTAVSYRQVLSYKRWRDSSSTNNVYLSGLRLLHLAHTKCMIHFCGIHRKGGLLWYSRIRNQSARMRILGLVTTLHLNFETQPYQSHCWSDNIFFIQLRGNTQLGLLTTLNHINGAYHNINKYHTFVGSAPNWTTIVWKESI